MDFRDKVLREGSVVFADIPAPPMNLLRPAWSETLFFSFSEHAGSVSRIRGNCHVDVLPQT
jgi:hypothetical protein